MHAHTSQFYEWLPWIEGHSDQVPTTDEDRLAWLKQRWPSSVDERMRQSLRRWYGEEKGDSVQHAEAFEICEYGRQPDEAEIKRLFPMVP